MRDSGESRFVDLLRVLWRADVVPVASTFRTSSVQSPIEEYAETASLESYGNETHINTVGFKLGRTGEWAAVARDKPQASSNSLEQQGPAQQDTQRGPAKHCHKAEEDEQLAVKRSGVAWAAAAPSSASSLRNLQNSKLGFESG